MPGGPRRCRSRSTPAPRPVPRTGRRTGARGGARPCGSRTGGGGGTRGPRRTARRRGSGSRTGHIPLVLPPGRVAPKERTGAFSWRRRAIRTRWGPLLLAEEEADHDRSLVEDVHGRVHEEERVRILTSTLFRGATLFRY